MQTGLISNTTIIDVLKVVGSFVAAIVAVFIAVRKREIFRPSLRLSLGTIRPQDFENTSRLMRSKTTSALLYLLEVPNDAPVLVCLWLRVKNTSSQPLRNVRVELMFPEQFFLPEHYEFSLGGHKVVPEPLKMPAEINRSAVTIAGVAKVIFNIPLLRPDETITCGEPLKFGPRMTSDADNSWYRPWPLVWRLKTIPTFIDCLRVSTYVFSETTRQTKQIVDVYALQHKKGVELTSELKQLENAIWDGAAPQAGQTYYNPLPW